MTDETPKPDDSLNPLRPEKLVIGGKPVFGNGRRKAENLGKGIRKYWSHMGHKTVPEIQAIATDERMSITKRIAATYLLRAVEKPDKVGVALVMKMIEHTDGSAIKRIDLNVRKDESVNFVKTVFDELIADVEQVPLRKLVGPVVEGEAKPE